MDYFDLHCDTATELFDRREPLISSGCHISKESIDSFDRYGQVFAVFSKIGMSDDECYKRFFEVKDHFQNTNGIEFRLNGDEISPDGNNYILSVEDGRLLAGDISRLESLYDRGVRILTPLWSGTTCIGGSFDTDEGLSEFGRSVVRRCISLGIILDISHSSGKSSDEILEGAEGAATPVIASHSDSYEINPHPRNITDNRAVRVAKSGGVIGICLHSPHLGTGTATSQTAFEHIDHLISVAGEDHVCIGADLDGTDSLPSDITTQKDIIKIAEQMSKHNYSDSLIRDILYNNAYNFFRNNLAKRRIIE